MKGAQGYLICVGIGLNMFFTEYAFMWSKEEKVNYENVYRK